MAKTENKELTLESAIERIAELEAVIVEKDQEIESLKNTVNETSHVIEKKLHIVPGTYKSKEHGVTIKFKDGFTKTRVGGEIIASSEIIKNKGGIYTEFLDNLIKIQYGGIEEVKK